LREGAENGDPKHLRDVEALGNICAMIDRGVLLFVDEGVIEKEYGNFRESEHYFGFLRVCVCVSCVVKSPKKKRGTKISVLSSSLSFSHSRSPRVVCLFLLLLVVVVLLLRP
tara:strand:+ start:4630 stop:4965 length:336 start_codon:yes stop_codon:yes gene_type:complete